MSYITVVCVQGIPILSPLLFMPSLYSTLRIFNLLVKMYVDMACIVMYDNISIARSKRVNEKIVLCYTVQDEDQFPCKSSGLWFTWIISNDIDMACIIMYC